jgi:hypothetical protein
MTSPRLRILLAVVLSGLAAPVVLQVACGSGTHHAAPAAELHLAAALPTLASPSPAAASPGTLDAVSGADRLAAVESVRRFCRGVDQGRLWLAAGQLAGPGVWSRAQLRGFTTFRFLSARVVSSPASPTVRLLARVVVRSARPGPLPDGVSTLFFTLGRVGTTTGGWLITAAGTSP